MKKYCDMKVYNSRFSIIIYFLKNDRKIIKYYCWKNNFLLRFYPDSMKIFPQNSHKIILQKTINNRDTEIRINFFYLLLYIHYT